MNCTPTFAPPQTQPRRRATACNCDDCRAIAQAARRDRRWWALLMVGATGSLGWHLDTILDLLGNILT